jgi:excisionase family DNA binding protein
MMLDIDHPMTENEALDLLTAEEAAAILKVTPNTVYRLMRSGEITVVEFGRSRRITRRGLQKFIASHSRDC